METKKSKGSCHPETSTHNFQTVQDIIEENNIDVDNLNYTY